MKVFRLFCLLAVFSVPVLVDQAGNQLNLLIIMTDQQRFDALIAAGNTVLQTPNLDRIANEGVLFENAYTPVPVCGPTRTSILTGLSMENTGIFKIFVKVNQVSIMPAILVFLLAEQGILFQAVRLPDEITSFGSTSLSI